MTTQVRGDSCLSIEDVHDIVCFFFSSRRRHTRCLSDWSSDVCSSDLRTADQLRGHDPSLKKGARWAGGSPGEGTPPGLASWSAEGNKTDDDGLWARSQRETDSFSLGTRPPTRVNQRPES